MSARVDVSLAQAAPAAFVRAHTRAQFPQLLPELELLLAHEMLPLWQVTEQELAASDIPPPYWAFAWAGGQALARYVLDCPELVRGRNVVDLATGCGVVAIAAAYAGAAVVRAVDIDPLACAAAAVNAEHNKVAIHTECWDLLDDPNIAADVVLAGDVFFELPMARRMEDWLRQQSQLGAEVVIGDPQRTYMPRNGVTKLAHYQVPTTRELEDSDLRNASVWQFSEA
jgi:predicted nicotinamide N-methyase